MSTAYEIEKAARLEAEVRSIQAQLPGFIKKKKITPDSGAFVTYDENGVVVASRDLQASDIPELPMSKIKGLEEILYKPAPMVTLEQTSNDDMESRLNDLANQINTLSSVVGKEDNEEELFRISQVENQINHVITGELPRIEKMIPRAVQVRTYDLEIRQINETISTLLATINRQSQEIQLLRTTIGTRVMASNVTPGTYTKISVTRDGVVEAGDKLNVQDLPQLGISDITDLQIQLNAKATNEFVVNLSNTVSSLMEQVSKLQSPQQNQEQMITKITSEQLDEINQQITGLRIALTNYQRDTDKKIASLASVAVIKEPLEIT